MKKQLIAFLLIWAISVNLTFSQIESIKTDRPDQTECPFIVPVNYVQIENGFSIEKPFSGTKVFTHPSTLWKYGINPRLELRIITDFISEKINNKVSTRLEPLTIGFKVNLFEGRGILPKTSFIGSLTTDLINGNENDSVFYSPSFRFTMSNDISEKFSIGYNIGAEWSPDTAYTALLFTLSNSYSVTDKFGIYIEIYGFLRQKQKSDLLIDGGFTYLLTPDLMIDLSAGKGLSRYAPDHYLAFGISWRFSLCRH